MLSVIPFVALLSIRTPIVKSDVSSGLAVRSSRPKTGLLALQLLSSDSHEKGLTNSSIRSDLNQTDTNNNGTLIFNLKSANGSVIIEDLRGINVTSNENITTDIFDDLDFNKTNPPHNMTDLNETYSISTATKINGTYINIENVTVVNNTDLDNINVTTIENNTRVNQGEPGIGTNSSDAHVLIVADATANMTQNTTDLILSNCSQTVGAQRINCTDESRGPETDTLSLNVSKTVVTTGGNEINDSSSDVDVEQREINYGSVLNNSSNAKVSPVVENSTSIENDPHTNGSFPNVSTKFQNSFEAIGFLNITDELISSNATENNLNITELFLAGNKLAASVNIIAEQIATEANGTNATEFDSKGLERNLTAQAKAVCNETDDANKILSLLGREIEVNPPAATSVSITHPPTAIPREKRPVVRPNTAVDVAEKPDRAKEDKLDHKDIAGEVSEAENDRTVERDFIETEKSLAVIKDPQDIYRGSVTNVCSGMDDLFPEYCSNVVTKLPSITLCNWKNAHKACQRTCCQITERIRERLRGRV